MEIHLNNTASQSPSRATPNPTTFVQADANTFRDLVQKLTGFTNDIDKLPHTCPARLTNDIEKLPHACPARFPSKTSLPSDSTSPRRPPFKLQERRRQHAVMRKLDIKLGITTQRDSPSHCMSHSQALRLNSPVPSPVTPLGSESLFYSTSGTLSPSSPPMILEEEKAIAEKGFYLHPSPLNTPRGSQAPELLTLFPITSHSLEKRD